MTLITRKTMTSAKNRHTPSGSPGSEEKYIVSLDALSQGELQYIVENSNNRSILSRAGATGTVGPVLAGPIFVKKRGRDKLYTNTIVSVSMRKRRCTHIHTLIECSRWIMEQ